jgi:hypothetical protein
MDDNGKITSFDKSHYDQLITYLSDVDGTINTSPGALGPSADLKLDTTLGSRLHPGSQDWPVVKDFTTQAGTFGGSVHERYSAVELEVRGFTTALKGAEEVFSETNNLTTYDASKFGQEYPDVVGPGGGGGGTPGGGPTGGGPPGGGTTGGGSSTTT